MSLSLTKEREETRSTKLVRLPTQQSMSTQHDTAGALRTDYIPTMRIAKPWFCLHILALKTPGITALSESYFPVMEENQIDSKKRVSKPLQLKPE
jgi:hypothetical protein